MRSRANLVAVVALAAAAISAVSGQPEPREPGRNEIESALAQLATDPNLAPERKVSMLRWVTDESPGDDSSPVGWLALLSAWIRGLFGWLAESGRLLVWVVGAALAALSAAYLFRLVGRRGTPRAPPPSAPPSHVRDLDIRPESLPADIGAEALDRWNRGDRRVALSLLYRGLLSRLVHAHQVPIRASSTEGECLALAAPRLAPASASYAARLIGVWQGAVYGGTAPPTDAVEALCRDFGAALDGRA